MWRASDFGLYEARHHGPDLVVGANRQLALPVIPGTQAPALSIARQHGDEDLPGHHGDNHPSGSRRGSGAGDEHIAVVDPTIIESVPYDAEGVAVGTAE